MTPALIGGRRLWEEIRYVIALLILMQIYETGTDGPLIVFAKKLKSAHNGAYFIWQLGMAEDVDSVPSTLVLQITWRGLAFIFNSAHPRG